MSPEILHIFSIGAVILSVGVIISGLIGFIYDLGRKKEFVLMLAVPTVAALMYAAMASGVGIIEGFDGSVNVVRYADWIVTTPILLYILSFVMTTSSAQRWKVFMLLLTADIIMLVTGLGAEIYAGTLKTLFFAISMIAYIAMLYVIIKLLVELDRENLSGRQISSALGMAWVILILWSMYPFVWVFGTKGVATIGIGTEVVVYLVLDICAKLGFTALLARYLYFTSPVSKEAVESNHA